MLDFKLGACEEKEEAVEEAVEAQEDTWDPRTSVVLLLLVKPALFALFGFSFLSSWCTPSTLPPYQSTNHVASS